MLSVTDILKKKYPDLNPAEKKVADYILLNTNKIALLSMKKLSEQCGVSDNSVLRLCRFCGFSGYKDFKTELVINLLSEGESIYQTIDYKVDNFHAQKEKISLTLHESIKQTFQLVQENDIQEIAEKIMTSWRTIIIGLAGSAGVGYIFSDALFLLRVHSQALYDRIQIERNCISLSKHDVCFGISNTGETAEVLENLQKAQQNGAYTVLLSNNSDIKHLPYINKFLLTKISFKNIAGQYFGISRSVQLAIIELILKEINNLRQNERKDQ